MVFAFLLGPLLRSPKRQRERHRDREREKIKGQGRSRVGSFTVRERRREIERERERNRVSYTYLRAVPGCIIKLSKSELSGGDKRGSESTRERAGASTRAGQQENGEVRARGVVVNIILFRFCLVLRLRVYSIKVFLYIICLLVICYIFWFLVSSHICVY